MLSRSQSSAADESLASSSLGSGSRKGKGKRKGGKGKAAHTLGFDGMNFQSEVGEVEETYPLGDLGGSNLMDSNWGFASSSANINMIPGEFGNRGTGERPGTSAGAEHGQRAASSAGGSRGGVSRGGGGGGGGGTHRNNLLQAPIEEEFGGPSDKGETFIKILPADEVVDEDC